MKSVKSWNILIDEVQFETHTDAVLSSTCISRMQLFLSICIKSMMRFCGMEKFSAHTSLKCYSTVFENWCNEMDIIADSHFIFQVGKNAYAYKLVALLHTNLLQFILWTFLILNVNFNLCMVWEMTMLDCDCIVYS